MANTQTLPMDWATGDGTPDNPRQLYELNGFLFTMGTDQPVICSWFAMCEEQASEIMSGPGGGGVPICTRCAVKVEKLKG